MLTDRQFESLDIYDLDEGALEAENRMKNLMWTVSGDYTLDTKLDLESFSRSKYVSMYDAVKQGGFSRYFDKDAFALYLAKKMYYGAEAKSLTAIAQLCVDAAVFPLVAAERPGVSAIREKAFSWIQEHRFSGLTRTLAGKIRLAYMKGAMTGDHACEGRIRTPLELILALEQISRERLGAPQPGHAYTMDLIRTVDRLYNTVIDPLFEKTHGDLEKILAVTLEEMRETDWRSFAEEEAWEDTLERILKDEADLVTRSDAEPTGEKQEKQEKKKARQIIRVDEAALEKMHGYVELTFGRSYLSEARTKRLCYRLCRGAHADCSLYYTDGVAVNPVIVNAQHVNAVRHVKNNQRLFLNMQNVIRRNVESLTAYLKRALELRTMTERIPSAAGTVIPARLWKIGRLEDPGKLFYRTTKALSTEFAVEILMDGSGSQRERQGLVAIQAYIISAALSGIGLPHRIESFCSFWDYTIMHRLRDFDEPPQADQKVLQFVTSSNNRDGLAIRAAGDTLLQRREENRILIVLSDGKPNDVIVNRPGSRNPLPYCGDYGVKDTAFEVRSLRSQGVYVLGVFTGKEKDLSAEKLIFGKDFAYVRDIRNFSRIVGLYLHRLLEQDTGILS